SKKFNVVTPNNSACFYFDEKVFCIDDDHSNIEECSKSHVKYNYEICGRYVLNLTRFNGPNHLYARLRNYPDKSKIELNPRLDAEECKENGGIQLKYQNVFQYICVLPDSGKEDLSNKIILTVDEKPYYVYTDNTNIDLCIESSQNYNKEQCLFLINLIGRTDNINPYYIYNDNTNIELCNETSQRYNKEQCLFLINLIGKTDDINVKTIN
ncbi:hypothetical protein BCR32DRAFT_287858, partial [Anaeromyces robustus]